MKKQKEGKRKWKTKKGTGEVRIISSWRIKFLPVWKYCDFLWKDFRCWAVISSHDFLRNFWAIKDIPWVQNLRFPAPAPESRWGLWPDLWFPGTPVPHKGFSDGSDGKESACNSGDPGLIPGLGRSPEEGNGYPLQYSCLENFIDKGAWWATVHRVAKSQTQLSN